LNKYMVANPTQTVYRRKQGSWFSAEDQYSDGKACRGDEGIGSTKEGKKSRGKRKRRERFLGSGFMMHKEKVTGECKSLGGVS